MAKPTGFLEYERQDNKINKPIDRIKNFNEFRKPLNANDRVKQGARCMNCGVPMCQSALKLSGMVTGCPLHNLIPEWNDEIYHGNNAHALARLLKTSSFPEFTGRVCPALCEKACICGIYDDPVTVHENELYIIETAFENGLMKPRIPAIRTNFKIAVIGSGPSGLAVADRLNQRGHNVTVYEREDRIGGLLMYGIPNMKLDKSIVLRRQKLMEEEGIQFVTNTDIGKDITTEEVLDKYDAVVIAIGAKKARSLAVKGFEENDGIYYAVDFLKSTTKSLLENQLKSGTYISAKNKHVVIVGGGDTGNDCTGTSIRHGCASVTQIEMMPKPPIERTENNPWPEWPKVLKTDYGQEESIAKFGKDPRVYETTIKEIKTKDKKITSVITVKVKFENGKLKMIDGTEQELPCDLLLIAAGFVGCEDYLLDEFDLARTNRNTIETKQEHYKTSNDKIFACGDCHRGQSLVVWAIREGRECACEVDEFLTGYTNME